MAPGSLDWAEQSRVEARVQVRGGSGQGQEHCVVADDALGRILLARSPQAALLIPEGAPVDASTILEQYRRVVTQVHPDRCTDRRAHESFQRASYALDALSTRSASSSQAPSSWYPAESATGQHSRSGRWWDTGCIQGLERRIAQRAEIIRVLREELRISQGLAALDTQVLQQLRCCARDAERACEHLDRCRGIGRSHRWPAGDREQGTLSVADIECRIGHFADCLVYLRVIHLFCAVLGRTFDHAVELEAIASESLSYLRKSLRQQQAQQQPVAEQPTVIASEDSEMIDPLDAYMATIEAELQDHAKASAVSASTPVPPSAVAQPPVCTESMAMDCSMGSIGSPKRARPEGTSDLSSVGLGLAGYAVPASHWAARSAPRAAIVDPSQPVVVKLATGGLLHAPTAAAKKAKEPEPGLQDRLLGDLASDDEEI